jgi:ERCC4-type nuclease
VLRFLPLMARSQASAAAEILFLRKQLAFYQERKIKPRRFDDAARLSLLLLSRLFDWKSVIINVKPETLIGWHRSLGPGLPVPSSMPKALARPSRHRLPLGCIVKTRSVLGGLHHEYRLERAA